MVNSNEYMHPARVNSARHSSKKIIQHKLTDKSQQAFALYKLSRAITGEILNTLAEAGIAPKDELQALLTAAGINLEAYAAGPGEHREDACHYCGKKT